MREEMNLIIILLISYGALSNATPESQINLELPKTVMPENYNLTLNPRVDAGERLFNGTVEITLKFIESTNLIVLHAKNLNIIAAHIKNKFYSYAMEYDNINKTEDLLTLSSKTGNVLFKAGSGWILSIDYSGELRNDNRGFYISNYTENTANFNKIKYFAATNFKQGEARTAFPCFDEPIFPAKFTVTIQHGKNSIALSNMPEKTPRSNYDSTSFLPSEEMSTSMLGIIIGSFECHSVLPKDTGIKYTLCTAALRGDRNTANSLAAAITSCYGIPEKLNKYFKAAYSPKLDYVVLPVDGITPISTWGLFTYPETDLLPNKHHTTEANQRKITRAVVEGYTRLWFDTKMSREEGPPLHMQEGLPVIYQYIIMDQIDSFVKIFEEYQIKIYQPALIEGHTFSAKSALLASTAIVNMWKHALGNSVWQKAIEIYLERNKFNTATERELYGAIDIALNELKNGVIPTLFIYEMMLSWTLKRGYPLVEVRRDYDLGNFEISQQPFNREELKKYGWYIPINAAKKSLPLFEHTESSYILFCSRPVRIENNIKNSEWLILNKQATGYYRVNYDVQNWQLIIEALKTTPDEIHTLNRAQLLSDAFALAESSRLSYGILLDMLPYLRNETEYAPWDVAEPIITNIHRNLVGHSSYERYREFITNSLIGRNYYDDDILYRSEQVYFRKALMRLACLLGIENCLSAGKYQLNNFIIKNGSVDLNTRWEFLCTAMRNATDIEFDNVYQRLYEYSYSYNTENERSKLWQILACTMDPQQMEKLLSNILNLTTSWSAAERQEILKYAYSQSSTGLLASIKFLQKNYRAYIELGGSIDATLKSMLSYLTKEEELQEMLKIKDLTAINLQMLLDERLHQRDKLRSEVNNWLLKQEQS